VAKEALCRRPDQVAQSISFRLSSELESCCVVHDDDLARICCSPGGLPEVRSQDRFGCDLIVAEKAIGSLEFSIIERLREAGTWVESELVPEQRQPTVQAGISEVGARELL
jgi:hypothetical protein